VVRPAPVEPTDDAATAARRVMTDDGFNIGVLYAGDRPAYRGYPQPARAGSADLEAEFEL
jgi:2-oxoglutarate ferredoxin oxidoreductase subunit beta